VTPPSERPIGQRFTHVYVDRGKPLEDSPRVRRRMAAVIDATPDLDDLSALVPRALGLDLVWSGFGAHWSAFLRDISVPDLLDLVTLAFRHLTSKKRTGLRIASAPANWIMEVQHIFEEENFGYTVDEQGGVHYRLDEEFARNKSAAIATLQAARYANALDAFVHGMSALAAAPPDGKNAIRSTFAAVEGLFRLVAPNAHRLGAAELDALLPLLQKLYAADAVALRSSTKMIGSLKDWVDAAHFYRHEQGAQEVAQPPLTLAVYLVSSGASHLRWLAELDARIQAA
jgi:hypothetical protein